MDLTVLVCTYNRADDLRKLLESVLAQETSGFEYEVVVVDNNSPDHTRAVVEALIDRGHERLRYCFEGQQGKAFALNSGLAEVRGEVVAIIDDDQLMPPGYVAALVNAFREHPDVAFIGGKVLPIWEKEPPAWLTHAHWGPIGMSDYGEVQFTVDERRPVCLLTCAFRLADLNSVGGYRQELGVTGSAGIGSTEDIEIQERLWSSGRPGLYLPGLVLQHHAPAGRLTRSYFRRWHRGHGRFRALFREKTAEQSRARLFDVPLHMYRQALADTWGWLSHSVRRNEERAFDHQLGLCFFRGYFRQRYADHRAHVSYGAAPSVRRLLESLIGMKRA